MEWAGKGLRFQQRLDISPKPETESLLQIGMVTMIQRVDRVHTAWGSSPDTLICVLWVREPPHLPPAQYSIHTSPSSRREFPDISDREE